MYESTKKNIAKYPTDNRPEFGSPAPHTDDYTILARFCRCNSGNVVVVVVLSECSLTHFVFVVAD